MRFNNWTNGAPYVGTGNGQFALWYNGAPLVTPGPNLVAYSVVGVAAGTAVLTSSIVASVSAAGIGVSFGTATLSTPAPPSVLTVRRVSPRITASRREDFAGREFIYRKVSPAWESVRHYGD